jgi:hypothetical protein
MLILMYNRLFEHRKTASSPLVSRIEAVLSVSEMQIKTGSNTDGL